ncbi:MAG: hypothetical protein IKK87_05175 [Bacteroidaceae bacterium]|nr:hypothetical protein [Bacteroidaceae bacterium]
MKKVLLLMAAAVMSVSITFAQADDKAAKKAAKEAAKALKAEIKAANKVLREAQGALNAVDGNVDQAKALIEAAMENKHTASNPDTWYTAGKIQEQIYNKENEKMYLQQPYDQEKFFGSLSKMFDYFLVCDSLEQIPNEKGNVVAKYRPEMMELLSRIRINLVSGGVTYFNDNNNEKAFELFSKYIDVADAPLFASFNYAETDTLMAEIAYYATLAGLKLEDYNKALKYVDLAMKKEDVAQKAIEYKAMSYINLGDTVNWINALKEGVEKYPSVEYFYSNLISYYNNSGDTNDLVAFADEMLAKNPLPIFRFVKGYVYQNQKEYDKAVEEYKVCIEQDPNYTGAYRNLGICYCQMAQDLSDAASALDIKSKAYKAKKEEINAYYKLALPIYEHLRKIDDGSDPDVKSAWTNGLYTCYYMLNMGKEFEEIEKLMNL